MTPLKIQARDNAHRVVAFIVDKTRENADFFASEVTISSIEYTFLEQNNGHAKPIPEDIGFQFLVFIAPHRWKKACKRVRFKYRIIAHRPVSWSDLVGGSRYTDAIPRNNLDIGSVTEGLVFGEMLAQKSRLARTDRSLTSVRKVFAS
jgi:hypothetical protein